MSEAVAWSPARIVTGTPAAWPFVLATWIRSYAESEFARHIKPGVFHTFHHAIASKLLARCSLRLSVDYEDPALYHGWALHEEGVLHYLWVKPQFASYGIAEKLLDGITAPDMRYTHRTPFILASLPKTATYNPYLL